MKSRLPRWLELALVCLVVYPLDRVYARFIFPHGPNHWPFLMSPVPFLAILLSFLVLLWVPGAKWAWLHLYRKRELRRLAAIRQGKIADQHQSDMTHPWRRDGR